MFTGIVETTGVIETISRVDDGQELRIAAGDFARRFQPGDSVCVSGVCLTATKISPGSLQFDVVEETLRRSNLEELLPGSRVNLEAPVTLGSFLGGHLVQGHVDGVGRVDWVDNRGIERWLRLAPPSDLLRYIVEKGSIGVDGVSLTIADIDDQTFSVALVPHTLEVTTLGSLGPGSRVNIEVDLIARHVEKLVQSYLSAGTDRLEGMRHAVRHH